MLDSYVQIFTHLVLHQNYCRIPQTHRHSETSTSEVCHKLLKTSTARLQGNPSNTMSTLRSCENTKYCKRIIFGVYNILWKIVFE